ncbi:MAG: tol-pal system protein YbgF [Halofilum sp. (in: g-proteobacteria)]
MRPVTTPWLVGALACTLAALLPLPVLAQSGEEGARSATDRLEQRVRRLENTLDSDQLVRLMRSINSLDEEIRALRGDIETQGHQLEEMRERQRNLYSDLDRRVRELEVAGRQREDEESSGDDGASGSNSDEPGVSAAQEDAELTGAERAEAADDGEEADAPDEQAQREAYNEAFDLLKDGRYEAAADAFQSFLEEHPEGPYSDNAQYWLGESYYVTRDFEDALEAFRQTIERYPESAKVPDARLKTGYTLHELERHDEARTVLQEVMSEHSGGTVARLAEERLLRLQRQQQN